MEGGSWGGVWVLNLGEMREAKGDNWYEYSVKIRMRKIVKGVEYILNKRWKKTLDIFKDIDPVVYYSIPTADVE